MKYRFEVIYKEAHSAGLSPLFTILMIASLVPALINCIQPKAQKNPGVSYEYI